MLLGTATHIYQPVSVLSLNAVPNFNTLLPIVWPSKFSRYEDFLKWIKTTMFWISMNQSINVKVVEGQELGEFPLTQYEECSRRFRESGLKRKFESINSLGPRTQICVIM